MESSQSTITPTQSVKEFCFIGLRRRFKGTPPRNSYLSLPTLTIVSHHQNGSFSSLFQHPKVAKIRRLRVHEVHPTPEFSDCLVIDCDCQNDAKQTKMHF
jgi:hypothetical protein